MCIRDRLLDIAHLCATSGADSFLLDGMFGSEIVSASEWLELLTELRAIYPGSIEVRMGTNETPVLYLPHVDAAHVTSRTAVELLRTAAPETVLQLRLPTGDRYDAALEAWTPMLSESDTARAPVLRFLDAEITSPAADGFVITGAMVFDMLSEEKQAANPLGQRFRELRRAAMDRELGKGRPELRNLPLPGSEPNSHPE